MPKFDFNKFKKYVNKLDIENPQHQKKALEYVLNRSEYKSSERRSILNTFEKGDYNDFLFDEGRSASWNDFSNYNNVYDTIQNGLPGVSAKGYDVDGWIPFDKVSSRYNNVVAKQEQNKFIKQQQNTQKANQISSSIQNYDPTNSHINPYVKIPIKQRPYSPSTNEELSYYRDNNKFIAVNGKVVHKNSSMTRSNAEATQNFRQAQTNASHSMDIEAEAYIKAYNNEPISSNMGAERPTPINTSIPQSGVEVPSLDIDTSGFGNPRANPIGPLETPKAEDNSWGNFVNWAKEYKQQSKATSNTTQPLQSGPVSADDFAAISGGSNNAYDAMHKRLAARYNETDARIQAIKDNADLSEIDKTKKINEIYATYGDNVKNMNDVKQSLYEQARQGPSTMDYVYGYKVPQAITGVTLLGGMASMALGNSKGQKTNAELYSNPF